MLAFQVADCAFVLDVGRVLELVAPQAPQPLPGAHPAVLGLLAWRRRSLPVLDSRAALGLAPSSAALVGGARRDHAAPDADGGAPKRRIVVLQAEGQLLGLLVDGVYDVVTVRPEDLLDDVQAPLAHLSPFTLGCFRLAAGRALLLDVRPFVALLASPPPTPKAAHLLPAAAASGAPI